MSFQVRLISILSLLVLVCFPLAIVTAQQISISETTQLECGEIVEAETSPNERFQDYLINARAGTILNGRIEPIGATFNPIIFFADSGGSIFAGQNTKLAGLAEEIVDLQIGSSNPIMRVGGLSIDNDDFGFNMTFVHEQFNFYGAYTIYLGCTLRDGTVINPGDTLPATGDNTLNVTSAVPTFSGSGFPGLAPVDFANVAKIPMIANTPMTGAVAPDGSVILGYTVETAANDTLSLNFTRLSGNLNLGLVVLSADNKVVFQASLVTSSELTTKFTLPSAGTYTIGIFRIDLLSPAAPEATAFQLTTTLNP